MPLRPLKSALMRGTHTAITLNSFLHTAEERPLHGGDVLGNRQIDHVARELHEDHVIGRHEVGDLDGPGCR